MNTTVWRWFPLGLITAMGFAFAVNGYMVYTALRSFPGTAGTDGFDLSNDYRRVLQAAAQQSALGWRIESSLDENRRPILHLTDRAGAPLAARCAGRPRRTPGGTNGCDSAGIPADRRRTVSVRTGTVLGSVGPDGDGARGWPGQQHDAAGVRPLMPSGQDMSATLDLPPPAAAADTTCAHCGLPAASGRRFCCPGCAAAHDIIQGLGLGRYYRQRVLAADARPPQAGASRTGRSDAAHHRAGGRDARTDARRGWPAVRCLRLADRAGAGAGSRMCWPAAST